MVKLLVRATILGYFGFFMVAALGYGYYWHLHWRTPEQPIAFPHTVHAGQLELACASCHIWVESSPEAGVPPLEKCMSCHRNVATERPEVRKLARHVEEEDPVAWNRVHTLPDFIYFSHKRHIAAGLDCSLCHGRVREMEKIRRVRSLEMGWCITCHWGRGAPTDCAICHM